VVCALAFHKNAGRRSISGFGAVTASGAAVALVVRLAQEDPVALLVLGGLILFAIVGRPLILYAVKKYRRSP